MMKRGARAKFMPNSYVFPGGTLEAADDAFPKELTNRYYGIGDFHDPEPTRFASRVGAIRELFEESGLLLIDGEVWNAAEDARLEEWRQKVWRERWRWPIV